jgi:hypothetical protein
MLVSFADEPGTIARIMLQAALNGDRTKAEHAALPVSVEELALDVAACVAAGARAIHLHPRDSEGRERLDAHVVDDRRQDPRSMPGARRCFDRRLASWVPVRRIRRPAELSRSLLRHLASTPAFRPTRRHHLWRRSCCRDRLSIGLLRLRQQESCPLWSISAQMACRY